MPVLGRSPPVAQEPVSVLIANFENHANEPLFDGLVEQALGVGIEGASFITAYPRRDALRLVAQVKPGGDARRGDAQLVATRRGSSASSADRSRTIARYKLAVRIVDPANARRS